MPSLSFTGTSSFEQASHTGHGFRDLKSVVAFLMPLMNSKDKLRWVMSNNILTILRFFISSNGLLYVEINSLQSVTTVIRGHECR